MTWINPLVGAMLGGLGYGKPATQRNWKRSVICQQPLNWRSAGLFKRLAPIPNINARPTRCGDANGCVDGRSTILMHFSM